MRYNGGDRDYRGYGDYRLSICRASGPIILDHITYPISLMDELGNSGSSI